MNRTVAQFSTEELALIRVLVDNIARSDDTETAIFVAGVVNDNMVVYIDATVDDIHGLADHHIHFNCNPISVPDLDETIAAYMSKYRAVALEVANVLKYIDRFLTYARRIGATTTAAALERGQIDRLTSLDRVYAVGPTIRCITWIVETRDGADAVVPPFLTCVPSHTHHVMYYTVFRSNNRRIIKLVVDNYLVEIPFEITIPPGRDSITVLMIVQPISGTSGVDGVRLIVCRDTALDN